MFGVWCVYFLAGALVSGVFVGEREKSKLRVQEGASCCCFGCLFPRPRTNWRSQAMLFSRFLGWVGPSCKLTHGGPVCESFSLSLACAGLSLGVPKRAGYFVPSPFMGSSDATRHCVPTEMEPVVPGPVWAEWHRSRLSH